MSKFLDNKGLATLWANIKTLINTSLSDFGKKVILSTEKGTANGVAELDESGKVPASQLPSYVDDVLEYASITAFPATGETGKIYVSLSDNKTYRWSGSAYVEIASGVTLGETSSTAYRGDRGKIAYDHSQADHAPTTVATASADGLMSAADKKKLDNLSSGGSGGHTEQEIQQMVWNYLKSMGIKLGTAYNKAGSINVSQPVIGTSITATDGVFHA